MVNLRAPDPIKFLITMDTEGDNLWTECGDVKTENVNYLPRFQALCEAYGFKPTWLATHEIVMNGSFREFGLDCLKRRQAEIGTHLHAWDSPPLYDLTGDDRRHKPYLTEYPQEVLEEKLKRLTGSIQERLGITPVSHRAGRWAINEEVLEILIRLGYKVDCSVTPGVSWRHAKGDPNGAGGADYRNADREPYWMSQDSILTPGRSKLLQIPVSIVTRKSSPKELLKALAVRTVSVVKRRYRHRNIRLDRALWLRPTLNNQTEMIQVLQQAKRERWSCVEFMLHSSELMPGGSPNFPTESSINKLYDVMEATFEHARSLGFKGATLSDFYNDKIEERLK